ncbi:MAG TPA: HD domain-containing phosphohydrolase [Longimicrobiales bacterium]|nr:HD domain-containing phosphohydrolase [Longimicrobiales bacterium]
MTHPTRRRVLVVDDDPSVRTAHARLVERLGYEADTATDGIEAWAKLMLGFDLVLLDGDMPHVDGFALAERIRGEERYAHLPIVMVTGLTAPQDRRRALEIGINDFVQKPVDPHELALRAHWLIELKLAHDRLRERNRELERTIEVRTAALRQAVEEASRAQHMTHEAHLETIRRLTIAAEYRDSDTAGHIERIGLYAETLARAMGFSPGEVAAIRQAAPMHDVGKLGVPDRILLKPGPLDEEELAVMRAHPTVGASILAGSTSPVIQMGERIALSHHERWDGKGYPNGIAGEEIAIEGRICAVVDVFDALTMDRPYRRALPQDEVVAMMREERGKHFDDAVLTTFLDVLPEIVEIRASARTR